MALSVSAALKSVEAWLEEVDGTGGACSNVEFVQWVDGVPQDGHGPLWNQRRRELIGYTPLIPNLHLLQFVQRHPNTRTHILAQIMSSASSSASGSKRKPSDSDSSEAPSTKKIKKRYADPERWNTCKRCGVDGPDVKEECLDCRGLKTLYSKYGLPHEYWEHRRKLHSAYQELEAADKKITEAKITRDRANDAHLSQCTKFLTYIQKHGWDPYV